MKKGIIALMLGLMLSGLFSFIFFQIQHKDQINSKEVYYLQTGVYQTKENATNMQLELAALQMPAYVYQKDHLNYVICGISTNKEDLLSWENLLKQHQISYVQKEANLENITNEDEIVESLLEVLGT